MWGRMVDYEDAAPPPTACGPPSAAGRRHRHRCYRVALAAGKEPGAQSSLWLSSRSRGRQVSGQQPPPRLCTEAPLGGSALDISVFLFLFFKTGSCYVAQADLVFLVILLPSGHI